VSQQWAGQKVQAVCIKLWTRKIVVIMDKFELNGVAFNTVNSLLTSGGVAKQVVIKSEVTEKYDHVFELRFEAGADSINTWNPGDKFKITVERVVE
jgi:hypothetical protein